jgi:SAM-dependent methyltransferase
MPAEIALWDLTAGMQRAQIATLLVTSGIADALDRDSRHPVDIARELDLNPDVTQRVLEAATASRLLRMNRTGYVKLSRIGLPLRTDDPRSIAAWVVHHTIPSSISAYGELSALLRTGAEPSGYRRATGQSLWEYLHDHPEDGVCFGEAMRQLTAIDIKALVRAYPWPRHGTICDIAGGTGTFLAAILTRRPNAYGVLIDASEVLVDAADVFDECGLADRVERTPGDLFANVESQADVYILKWILHNWNDETCKGILRRVRAAMPPGAKVVVIDQHRAPSRPNAATSMTDLHMLVACEGGRERSPGEVHELMAAAGLRRGRVRHAGLHMFVEGIAA